VTKSEPTRSHHSNSRTSTTGPVPVFSLGVRGKYGVWVLVGGIGMAQAVDTTDLVDTGTPLGAGKHLLWRGCIQCELHITTWKQPQPGMVVQPVVPQALQQCRTRLNELDV